MVKRKLDDSTDSYTHIRKQLKILHPSVVSDDGALRFDFMTSLQNIVMAKIIINFWTDPNTQENIMNSYSRESNSFNGRWYHVEEIVVSKVSELSLPDSIVQKLRDIVPYIGKSIFNWIRCHDDIFETTACSEYFPVDMMNNITWTARGKIDCVQTAKNILANRDICLSDDHKYKLACAYCLEDEIITFASKVVGPYYLNSVHIDTNPMAYFWTAQITSNYSNLYRPTYRYFISNSVYNTDLSINENMIQFIINDYSNIRNEISIMHLWNKLDDEEQARNVTSLIKTLPGSNLSYSLLSKLNYDQQREFFSECSYSILHSMYHDWLWKDHFLSTAIHILDVMDDTAFLFTLEKIHEERNKISAVENKPLKDQYKFIFKQVWLGGFRSLKDTIFFIETNVSITSRLRKLLLVSLSWEHDMDIIKLILNDLNPQQKKCIIMGRDGIDYCVHLIKNEQWDHLDLFIECTLSEDEDINRLKKQLVTRSGHDIAKCFIKTDALDKVEHFMSWALKTEEDINKFRQSLASTKYRSTIDSIITNNKVDFSELENHFNWCAKGALEVITELRAKFSEFCCFGKFVAELKEENRYEMFNQVLNWTFSNNQQQIQQFKGNMYKNSLFSVTVRGLVSYLIKNDDSLKMLDKFVCWLFTDEQEVQEFKTWLLYPQESINSICTDLLRDCHLELADKFIDWCGVSAETFKNALILTDDWDDILNKRCQHTQDYLQLLIMWFSLTEETVQKFKANVPEYKCPDNFYKLLDEFLENQSNSIDDEEDV